MRLFHFLTDFFTATFLAATFGLTVTFLVVAFLTTIFFFTGKSGWVNPVMLAGSTGFLRRSAAICLNIIYQLSDQVYQVFCLAL